MFVGCAGILREMQVFRLGSSACAAFALGLLLLLSGCRRNGDDFKIAENASSWRAARDSARQELREIPAPAKSRYISIHREPQWQNPFLSVERDMIQIRIYLADENGSPLGRGGVTRITAARRQVLNVRLADLPRALASLPYGAWPYGRVIAVGEGLKGPQDRAQIQRNVAITTKTLNDLGLVVEQWDGPGLDQ